eukprot:4229764-Pyramimonas_sp.AAC.1
MALPACMQRSSSWPVSTREHAGDASLSSHACLESKAMGGEFSACAVGRQRVQCGAGVSGLSFRQAKGSITCSCGGTSPPTASTWTIGSWWARHASFAPPA